MDVTVCREQSLRPQLSMPSIIQSSRQPSLSSTTRLPRSLLWVDLLAVLVVPDSWGRLTVAATCSRPYTMHCQSRAQSGESRASNIPHDLSVNGARDTVLELQVHLGNGVFGEDGGLRDIT